MTAAHAKGRLVALNGDLLRSSIQGETRSRKLLVACSGRPRTFVFVEEFVLLQKVSLGDSGCGTLPLALFAAFLLLFALFPSW